MKHPETIALDPTASSELLFKVQIDGGGGSARARVVCGAEVGFIVEGRNVGNDLVSFVIPPAAVQSIGEGIHKGRIEVVVDDGQYFAPLEFDVIVKRPVAVVAEAVQTRHLSPRKPTVTVQHVPCSTLRERYDMKRRPQKVER